MACSRRAECAPNVEEQSPLICGPSTQNCDPALPHALSWPQSPSTLNEPATYLGHVVAMSFAA
jgi:hypothetical protein